MPQICHLSLHNTSDTTYYTSILGLHCTSPLHHTHKNSLHAYHTNNTLYIFQCTSYRYIITPNYFYVLLFSLVLCWESALWQKMRAYCLSNDHWFTDSWGRHEFRISRLVISGVFNGYSCKKINGWYVVFFNKWHRIMQHNIRSTSTHPHALMHLWWCSWQPVMVA